MDKEQKKSEELSDEDMKMLDFVGVRMLETGVRHFAIMDASPAMGLIAIAMCVARFGVYVQHATGTSLEEYRKDFREAFDAALKDVKDSNMLKELQEIEKARKEGE